MNRRKILPVSLLGLGLAGTAAGLVQQTHQQRRINQQTGAIVLDLAETKRITTAVDHRLHALTAMNNNLVATVNRIHAANHALTMQANQMATILTRQSQIWSTLGRLNTNLNSANAALMTTHGVVGLTLTAFQGRSAIVPTTKNMSHLIAQLDRTAGTTAHILQSMDRKLQLLGTANQALP